MCFDHTMRPVCLLVVVLFAFAGTPAAARAADPVVGRWVGDSGGVSEIDEVAPGQYVSTVLTSRGGPCPAPPGDRSLRFSGSFPSYVGERGYVDSGTCEPTGQGAMSVRVDAGGLRICSRAPGRGLPAIDEPGADCNTLRRPGATASEVACGAVWLRRGRLVAVRAARVLARERRVSPAAVGVRIRGAGCARARTLLARVLGAADERLALQRAGLVFIRVGSDRVAGRDVRVVTASDGGVQLVYERVGEDLAVDGRLYRAGQQLIFGTRLGVPGAGCTGGFAVRLRDGSPGLLSAGHCGRNTAGDLWPNVFWYPADRGDRVIGHTVADPWPAGPDALAVRLRRGVRWAPSVERGGRAPLTVTGLVGAGELVDGLPVCFAGRVSGADRCGKVSGSRGAERCTDVETRRGDSGGPVYYAPDGTATRAVGIVAIRRSLVLGHHMCFTPIETALQATGATLVTGY